MRNKLFYSAMAAIFLAAMIFTISSCNKDDDDNNEPDAPTYTDGTGEIGNRGGTVKIEDEDSPINGASVEIPEGALNESVEISIEEANDIDIEGHDEIKVVKFLPEGTEFSKEVKITLPWSSENQTSSNTNAYYYNDEKSLLEQLEKKNVNEDKKQVTAYTQHFSGFFSDTDELSYNIGLFKTGSYFGGYFNLRTPFNEIPEDPFTERYADEIIEEEDGQENCFVRITFELFEKDGLFSEEVADMTLYIKNNEENGTWSIWVDKANSSVPELPGGPEQIFHKYELDFEQMLDIWMSGYPFVAVFDEDTYLNSDFEINEDNDYKMKAEWAIVKNYNGFLSPWTWTARYIRSTERLKWSELSTNNEDSDHSNIIDEYENNTTPDLPPAEPSVVKPEDGAEDVSTNVTLLWDCSDPNGDDVSYDVWLSTEYPPNQKVADNIYDNNHSAQNLEPNTTYYWAIDAFDDTHTTQGPIWEFTTGEEGGGNNPPNEPTLVAPENETTDVSLNPTLEWDCTDPEGDELDYNIYFGTSQNPSEAETYYTSNTYEPGNLEENTTYYWKIEAFEVDNEAHSSESEIWEFSTGEDGGGGGGTTGTFTDPRDGQTYETVEIGSQVWFAENLNYETDNSWWYDNDPDNGDIYGRLYTWEAALNACPDGWHLPSDEEWKTLEMELGMSQSEADDTGYRGTDQGEQMKSTSGWDNNGNGTNTSGFSALPGGYRHTSGSFNSLGFHGLWWSSTEFSGSIAWYRILSYNHDDVRRVDNNKDRGFSVRCLKD